MKLYILCMLILLCGCDQSQPCEDNSTHNGNRVSENTNSILYNEEQKLIAKGYKKICFSNEKADAYNTMIVLKQKYGEKAKVIGSGSVMPPVCQGRHYVEVNKK